MDVHQSSITAAIARESQETPEVVHLPGDRNAVRLAQLYRSGHSTAVALPDLDQEAVRQLVRTRLAVQQRITALKHRIRSMLAALGHRLQGADQLGQGPSGLARPAPARVGRPLADGGGQRVAVGAKTGGERPGRRILV